jgi:hypothetical protein
VPFLPFASIFNAASAAFWLTAAFLPIRCRGDVAGLPQHFATARRTHFLLTPHILAVFETFPCFLNVK